MRVCFTLAIIALALQPMQAKDSKGIAKSPVTPSAKQTQKTNSDSENSQNPPVSVIVNNAPSTPDSSDNARQVEQQIRIQRWNVIFTGLLVLVGFATAVFVCWQAVEIRRSVQAIRDSLPHQKRSAEAAKSAADAANLNAEAVIVAERSWLLVKQVGNPPEDWVALTRTNGYTPGVILDFAVFGNTIVKVTGGRFAFHPVPIKRGITAMEPDLPEPPDYMGATTDPSAERGNVVAPTCYVYHFAWGGVLTSPDGKVLNAPGFRVGGPASYHYAT